MSQHIHRILGGIYLSSIEPINERVDLKQESNITSVLSVVHGVMPGYLSQNYRHLQIDITDEETVNILEHLPQAMKFIDAALFTESEESKKHQGSILIHCAQGQSRSVTVVIAYLMYKYGLSVDQATHAVRRKVSGAQPNDGFVEQLNIFKEMNCEVDTDSKPYKSFLVANSLRLDPSGGQLRQQGLWNSAGRDSRSSAEGCKDGYNLRCKRCRTVLATEADIETHEAPGSDSRQSQFIKTAPNSRRIISAVDASKTCSHYFVEEPMAWMGSELEKQDMEGKLCCPKCDAKVGGYSWKGSRCSCGKWMIPALHLQTAKVDSMSRH
ncbi:hypothetical protein OXX79_006816 [Metschnikowia pulcherrima]